MTLAQDRKIFDINPLIRLPENASDAEIQNAGSDCLVLVNYLSWILGEQTPPQHFGMYFTARNEFTDKKVVFMKNIYNFLKTFNPTAPENKEIAENLSEILDFFGDDKKMQLFEIMPNKFNLRVNVEAAIAQAIVEPHIKFDHNNTYRRVWHKLLQEQVLNDNNNIEQSR